MVFRLLRWLIRDHMSIRRGPATLGRACGSSIASQRGRKYTIHMKRTNLVLDEALLEEATRVSGEKTYSAAVQRALRDFVRRAKARQLLELRGSGLWEGNLSEMREDRPAPRKRRS